MEKFCIEELITASNAEMIAGETHKENFSLSTDTRTISCSDIYLPLKGENFDGRDFIENALEKGAKGYFTSNRDLIFKKAKYIFFVEDTLEAYLKIANFYKNKINPKTLAITGSSGKTTTKEMAACVFSKHFRVHKSKLNHNNEIGLCQTLLSMPDSTEVLILEMGMRGLGEIELLSKYSEPDLAIIVNTGTAHLGRLGSVENIAKAKCEITRFLKKNGTLIAHDTPLIRKINDFSGETIYTGLESKDLKILSLDKNFSEFVYKGFKYRLNIEGEYNIQNALFVIESALKWGMTPDEIALGLEKYSPLAQRWEIQEVKGLKLINDSYNANPDSMKASLKTFLKLYDGKKAVVLGGMLELGKNEVYFHEQIGEFLNNYPQTLVLTVGELAKNIKNKTSCETINFCSNSACAKYILENIQEGTTILFKASRSMKFEQIIEELKKQ